MEMEIRREEFQSLQADVHEIKQVVETLKARDEAIEISVQSLINHGIECEKLHVQNQEHRKRADDAINQNTQATLMQAKALADNSVVMDKLANSINRLTEQGEADRPEIEAVRDWRITWKTNKILFPVLIAVFTGLTTAVILFYNSVGGKL